MEHRRRRTQPQNALPPGASYYIYRKRDGNWAGSLTSGGIAVEAESPGALSLLTKLAKRWLATRKQGGPPPEPVASERLARFRAARTWPPDEP